MTYDQPNDCINSYDCSTDWMKSKKLWSTVFDNSELQLSWFPLTINNFCQRGQWDFGDRVKSSLLSLELSFRSLLLGRQTSRWWFYTAWQFKIKGVNYKILNFVIGSSFMEGKGCNLNIIQVLSKANCSWLVCVFFVIQLNKIEILGLFSSLTLLQLYCES